MDILCINNFVLGDKSSLGVNNMQFSNDGHIINYSFLKRHRVDCINEIDNHHALNTV